MSGLLDVLERGTWIGRKPHPNDGRSTRIHLTKGGRRKLVEILPDHFSRVASVMSGLEAHEHRTLLRLMQKFGDHLAALTPSDSSSRAATAATAAPETEA